MKGKDNGRCARFQNLVRQSKQERAAKARRWQKKLVLEDMSPVKAPLLYIGQLICCLGLYACLSLVLVLPKQGLIIS